MELKEIHAKQVTVEVRDEATGEIFRRTLLWSITKPPISSVLAEKTGKEIPANWFFCLKQVCNASEI